MKNATRKNPLGLMWFGNVPTLQWISLQRLSIKDDKQYSLLTLKVVRNHR